MRAETPEAKGKFSFRKVAWPFSQNNKYLLRESVKTSSIRYGVTCLPPALGSVSRDIRAGSA